MEYLKAALWVISAVTEFCEPEESDIEALRSYAPFFVDRPPDQLACEVIQQVLKAQERFSAGIMEDSEGALPDASIGPAIDKDDMGV